MEQAPQAEAARVRLEKEFAPRDREILAQQKEARSLEDKLVKNAAIMSDSERQRQETQIRGLNRELRRLQDEFREDLNLRRSQELGKLQSRVAEIIRGLGKSEKFDLIMIADAVIYAGTKVDITAKVVTKLKAEFKSN
jgi:outer membrane protein